jgi:outer membrane beta-barrel protein
MKWSILILALFVFSLAESQAWAGIRSRSWEFGPYLVFTDYDPDTEIDDDEGLGFRFGYNFTRLHEFEAAFSTVNTTDNVFGDIDVHTGEAMANYTFNFNFERKQPVVPYFTAGLGLLRIEVDAPGGPNDDETDPFFDIGGGVRFFISKTFNIRLDFRSVFYEGDNTVLPEIDFNNNEFSIGVGWVVGP